MKKIIFISLLISCLIGACKKTSNEPGHLKITVNGSSQFTQPFEAIVTISQIQTISQQDGSVSGIRTFDMGNVPVGTYTLSYKAYRVVNNAPVAPVYSNSQDITVVGGDQSLTVYPH